MSLLSTTHLQIVLVLRISGAIHFPPPYAFMVWRGTTLYTILRMSISLTGLQEYRFVVTARDGASDPRIATATVTVEVVDVDDELPIFHLTSYEAQVPENMPDYMVTQVKVGILNTIFRIKSYACLFALFPCVHT